MTSRLDDRTNDFIPATLNYNPDASTFWANYNTFIKLQNVIAQGSGQTWITVAIYVYIIVTLATCSFWLVKLQQKKIVVIREREMLQILINQHLPYPILMKRYGNYATWFSNVS